jgi:hypothetical protein
LKEKLAAISRRFMAVFFVAFVPLVSTALNTINSQVPDYAAFYAAAIAAFAAALAAALKALQEFVPTLSVGRLVGLAQPFAAYVDAFVQGSVGAFIVLISGWLEQADFSTWHSALVAAIIGALTAGWRALEGLLTHTEAPSPATGIGPPPA